MNKDILTYDMATTSVRAGIEINLYMMGKETSSENIEKIADFLHSRLISENSEFSIADLWLQSLLNDFSEKPESLDIAQYALDLSLVHKEFSGFKRLSEERMHVLINFCCALSRHARAEQWRYSRPYFDHPHIKYIA